MQTLQSLERGCMLWDFFDNNDIRFRTQRCIYIIIHKLHIYDRAVTNALERYFNIGAERNSVAHSFCLNLAIGLRQHARTHARTHTHTHTHTQTHCYLFDIYFATSANNKNSEKFHKNHNSECRLIIIIKYNTAN